MENLTWKTEKRKLKDLLPAEYNPRRLTETQHKDLKNSLTKFGLAEIPVINADNTILAGHQRVMVLTSLEGKDFEIDVRVPSRLLTESEAKEYNIRSNKNTGEWDFDVLANNFEAIELLDYGFKEFELGFMEEKEVVMDRDDLTKSLDSYLSGNIKQIVLYFTKEQYEDVIRRMAVIMEATGLEDHTAVFEKLLDNYEKDIR